MTCWEVVGEAMVESRFAAAHEASLPDPVGRDLELSLLMRRWQFARGGEGQVVLLSGQPGIGKSRLAGTPAPGWPPNRMCAWSASARLTTLTARSIRCLRMVERSARIQTTDTPARKLSKLRALLRVGWDQTSMAPLLANLLSITDDLPRSCLLDPVMRKQQMLRCWRSR